MQCMHKLERKWLQFPAYNTSNAKLRRCRKKRYDNINFLTDATTKFTFFFAHTMHFFLWALAKNRNRFMIIITESYYNHTLEQGRHYRFL